MSQSTYKEFHSTETALLKVHNDVTLNIDKGKVTTLTMLDLSAAFDTIDHSILIKRLSLWYGISGTALNWFLSYLTGRHQTIEIANCFSAELPTSCGVHSRILFWGLCCSRVMFWGLCCSLFTLRHSALLSKIIIWTTTFTQMIHRSTFLWLPRIQIAP